LLSELIARPSLEKQLLSKVPECSSFHAFFLHVFLLYVLYIDISQDLLLSAESELEMTR
jgi:hypothetical protein